MRLADRQGKSLEQVLDETPVSHFFMWREFFRKEIHGFHREDYLVAWMLHWYFSSKLKEGKTIPFETFLIEFQDNKRKFVEVAEQMQSMQPARLPGKKSIEQQEFEMSLSKGFWFSNLQLHQELKDV